MPWSNDVLTRTVTGSYLSASGSAAQGKISFRPTSRILDEDDTIILNTTSMIVTLDVNGEFSIELPVTDNPALKPAEWAYEVTVKIYGVQQDKFYMLLPYGDGTPINIVNVISAGTSATTVGFSGTQTALRGPAGQGVPIGGTTSSILAKSSNTSYDTAWTDAPTLDAVNFDTTAGETSAVGKLSWNDTDGTLDLGLKGGNVTLQVGQETVHMCVNRTGATIPEGKVVRLFGASGQRVGIALAQADSEQNSSKAFGVTTEDIDDNHTGFITTEGFVRNIDTSALTEGDIIWLDPLTAGGMTTTKPSAPDHLVMIGVCVVQGNNGIVWVHVQVGYELDELHNVKITEPLLDGQVLSYDAAQGLWVNRTL